MRFYWQPLFFLSYCACFGQQKMATTFQKAIDKGISIEKLDSTYPSALSSDSLKSVFVGQEKIFIESYHSLLQDLDTYLKNNGFKWDKTTRCFNRIYFNASGNIDYFLFNFKSGEIEIKKEALFEKLLAGFIKQYQFPLKANSKFAQCSPVTYLN